MSKKTKSPAPEFENGQCVWISKWALSDGIKTATFVGKTWSNADFLFNLILDGTKGETTFFGREFHVTEQEAITAANCKKDKRIKSLQKQIAKLEQLKF